MSSPSTALGSTQNPLVAQYQITQTGGSAVWVEFGTDTSYGRQTSTVTIQEGGSQTTSILVAGMKASTTYHMRARVDFGSTVWADTDHTFTTGALPSGNKTSMTVTRPGNNSIQQSGVELLDLLTIPTNNISAAVADLQGNIIWYYPLDNNQEFAFPIKPLPDGNMLVNVTGPETATGIVNNDDLREVDLTGKIVRHISIGTLNQSLAAAGFPEIVGGAVHHDVCILPNGHWVLITNTEKDFTNLAGYPGTTQVVGDYLIDLDPNWNPVWVWSTFDHLDVNRHLFGLPDWTHANALVYDPADGNLVLSMRNQSWIIKIDYNNGAGPGDILWTLGDQGDFSGISDPTQWFYAQHYPYIISSSGSQVTLAVWDDGGNRVLNDSGAICVGLYPNCYSRAVIYNVDESTKTASVAWQDLPGYFTPFGGSIEALSNGDVEFDTCDPLPTDPVDTALVFEVTGLSGPQDPTEVWELDITGGLAYRAYRIPSLYPGVTWTQ